MDNQLENMIIIPETEEGRKSFDKLVKSAEECFSEQGYRNTTVKDIARRAGMSVGGFYIYFQSKYQVYVYVMQRFAKSLQAHLDSRGAKITDRTELQVQYIMEFIRFAYQNPACYNLIFESLYINRELFLEYYYRYATHYVPGLVKKEMLPQEMDPLVWSFISMGIGNFIGLKVLAEDDAGEEAMEKIERTIRRLLTRGLSD